MKNILISIGFIIMSFFSAFGLFALVFVEDDYICPIIKEKEIEYINIGYIDCYNDDGTGPWYKCSNMEVRCYNKIHGQRVKCPI